MLTIAARFVSSLVASDQTPTDGPHAEEGSRQMDAQNLLPLRQRHPVDHGGPGNSGCVHEPFHDAETGGCLLDEALDEIRVRDIACAREDAIFGKGVPSGFKPVRVHVG
jgi:hypothetical protein